MRTFTMVLKPKEREVLRQLADEKGMTQAAIIIQALRLYQVIEKRLKEGDRIFVESDKAGRAEILTL